MRHLLLLVLPLTYAAALLRAFKPLDKTALEQLESIREDPANADKFEVQAAVFELMGMNRAVEEKHVDAFEVLMKYGLLFDRFVMNAIPKFPAILKIARIYPYLIDKIPSQADRCAFVQFLVESHPHVLFYVSPKSLGLGCVKRTLEFPSRTFWQLDLHLHSDRSSVNLAFLVLTADKPFLNPQYVKDLKTPFNRGRDTIFLELILWSKYKHPEWHQIGMKEFKQMVVDLHNDGNATSEHYIRLFRCVLPLLDSEVSTGFSAYLEELKETGQLRLHQIIMFCLDLNLNHLQSWPAEEREKFLADIYYEWVVLEARLLSGSDSMANISRLLDYTMPAYLNQLTDASPAINHPECMVQALLSPQGREFLGTMDLTTINWARLLYDEAVKYIRIVQTVVSVVGEFKCLDSMSKLKAGAVRATLFPILLKIMLGHYFTLEMALAEIDPVVRSISYFNDSVVQYVTSNWDLLLNANVLPLHKKSISAVTIAAKSLLGMTIEYRDTPIQLALELAQHLGTQ